MKFFKYLIAFFIGSFSYFDLNLIGRVPLSEVISFGSISFLPKIKKHVYDLEYYKRYKFALFALFLWIFGIVISDIIANNNIDSFLKGILKPVFSFLWLIFFLKILTNDYRALLLIPLGKFFASLQNYFFPREYSAEYLLSSEYTNIAFGISPILLATGAYLSIFFFKKSKPLSVISLLITSTILAWLGAPRSMSALFIFVAILISYQKYFIKIINKNSLLSIINKLGIFLIFVVIFSVIFYVYVYAALKGFMGPEQAIKLYEQSNNFFGLSPLGLFIGGRPQFFAGLLAIWDNPLFGYGSWSASQLSDYFYKATEILGISSQTSLYTFNDGIGHSILLVAWIENSILAFFAMLMIGYCVFKVFITTLSTINDLTPYLLITLVFFIWDYFFSPFGVEARFNIGLILALYITKFPFNNNSKVM